MPEARLVPNLPGWMQEHANRCLASGGTGWLGRQALAFCPPYALCQAKAECEIPVVLLDPPA
jgi:hypothetical protein